jgi:hypothetical protein
VLSQHRSLIYTQRILFARPTGCLAGLATLLVCALAAAQPAPAQGPQDGRTRLAVHQARAAYENLDLDEAERELHEARARCARRNCSAPVLAQVYVMLGVVRVGGRQDSAGGEREFLAAMQLDAGAEVDPALATPEIRAAFRRARRTARGGTAAAALHAPVNEQLGATPVPVYAQATGDAHATRGQLFYRVTGEADWQSLELEALGAGFGAEIPCAAVRAPGVEYYVELYGEGGALVATAGTEDAPHHVAIVASRAGAAPYLPGRLPPARCSPPAGAPRGAGERCERDGDCASGLGCDRGVCARREAGGGGGAAAAAAMPRVVVDLGLGAGLGFVDTTSNGTAPSYDEARFVDPSNPDAGVTCGSVLCPLGPRGVAAVPYAALGVRVNLIPRVAVAGAMRVGFDFGPRTTLAPFLLSLRGYVALTPAGFVRRGLVASAFLGTAVGQIQVRPQPPPNLPGRPTGHVITGLNNVHAGARVEYGITDLWHVGAELTLQYMFPRTLFEMDLQVLGGVHF